MQKTVYEDYKYGMQDTSRIYVGSRYTFAELLEAEEVPFRFRLIADKYLLPRADREDTLETHLYYLAPDSFLLKLYRQMKARVKVNVIEERKKLLGGSEKKYVTKTLSVEELAAMSREQKERAGLVIQELSVSKLGLLGL